jgi:hypothetical protein
MTYHSCLLTVKRKAPRRARRRRGVIPAKSYRSRDFQVWRLLTIHQFGRKRQLHKLGTHSFASTDVSKLGPDFKRPRTRGFADSLMATSLNATAGDA